MARPIDRILACPHVFAITDPTPGQLSLFRIPLDAHGVERSVVIAADDVARWYLSDEEDMWSLRDRFGPCRPPFPSVVVDFKYPPQMHADGYTATVDKRVVGASVFVDTVSEDAVLVNAWQTTRNPDSVFAVGASALVYLSDDGIPSGRFSYIRDGTGATLDADNPDDEPLRNMCSAQFHTLGKVALLALSLMHCKNVVLEDVEPSPALSRKWRKKTGNDLLRHTVVKLPSPTRKGSAGMSAAVGAPIAAHLVRGHFKTYTTENPLFGKHTGTYWWGWQARGDEKNGRVEKTYEVTRS